MGRKLRLKEAAKKHGRSADFYRKLVKKRKLTGYYAEDELNVDEDEIVAYWESVSNATPFERDFVPENLRPVPTSVLTAAVRRRMALSAID